MLLTCPSCETSFRVDPRALGSAGRTVRCARCQNSWFAAPEREQEAVVMAEAVASEGASASLSVLPAGDPVSWQEPAVEDETAPPLAPEGFSAAPSVAEAETEEVENKPARRVRPRPARRRTSRQGLGVASLAFAASLVVLAIAARGSIVRVIPGLAETYAAIGLPVNLRGLEFREVRTVSETQDGIPVLVIEGDVVNIVKHAVEVPRVRLAVLGAAGQELYSWTTLLPRSTLSEDEKVSFRSRLASPPPEGREVLVRFLTRSDLTSGR